MQIRSGTAWPLGTHYDGQGINFALFSENATAVELCLFDRPADTQERHRLRLPAYTNGVWHGYVPELKPGQYYGYRVHGPYDPDHGHRFNPARVLYDPCSRALGRTPRLDRDSLDYIYEDNVTDLKPNPIDNAATAPLSVVIDSTFDWQGDRHPRVPWNETVVYEAHVKGITMLNPEVPADLRGTYLGLASDWMIEYFLSLGITSIELLPVHQSVDEPRLVQHGLTNYWGYNTLGFFAPNIAYRHEQSPGAETLEFKEMVRRLHAAGLEVILDVVYNHTAEGDFLGPTLSFRGIDNRNYYRLDPENPRMYMNYAGCGNSLRVEHPRVLQMIMDSLRYWVTEMHVDGFRFDLAASLGRNDEKFDPHAPFFNTILQDPILSGVKLIAEPWDVFEDGHHLGGFPYPWSEWNDRYRDTMRGFWRGDPTRIRDFARRLAGSDDIYGDRRRDPRASVNYICSHDGFTLNDLVTYNQKHNEANLEQNRDGHNDNRSFNFGVEGPAADPGIREKRRRQMRNLLVSLFISQGVPMLLGGDEIGRTQAGNNNPYCQDNGVNYWNWDLEPHLSRLLEFTRSLVHFRRDHRVLHRWQFLRELPPGIKALELEINHPQVADMVWYLADGTQFRAEDWERSDLQTFSVILIDPGRELLLMTINASEQEQFVILPAIDGVRTWTRVLDTSHEHFDEGHDARPVQARYRMPDRCMAVFLSIKQGDHFS